VTDSQLSLLPEQTTTPPPVTGALGALRDAAASDDALTGDRYGWLSALLTETLPDPQPPDCEGCGGPLTLPETARVLWTCPTCHPEETQ
jgi:hypothetical protein